MASTQANPTKKEKKNDKFTWKHALLILVAVLAVAWRAAPHIKAEMEYRDMVARYNAGQMRH